MCLNCGDFVDLCFTCGDPNGGPYAKAKHFYVDQKYCSHMAEKYGHDTATWEDRYGPEEEKEDYIQSRPTE